MRPYPSLGMCTVCTCLSWVFIDFEIWTPTVDVFAQSLFLHNLRTRLKMNHFFAISIICVCAWCARPQLKRSEIWCEITRQQYWENVGLKSSLKQHNNRIFLLIQCMCAQLPKRPDWNCYAHNFNLSEQKLLQNLHSSALRQSRLLSCFTVELLLYQLGTKVFGLWLLRKKKGSRITERLNPEILSLSHSLSLSLSDTHTLSHTHTHTLSLKDSAFSL